MDRHLEYKNTLASNLITSIKANVFQMRARKHDSSLAASLFDHNVPVEVFHNLINTFKRHLPVWHRYFEIRRKALGQREIAYYDMWAPLAKKQTRLTFEQAVDMITEGLGAAGRRLHGDHPQGLPRAALGGFGAQQGQDERRVLVRRTGHPSLHYDEFHGRCRAA